MDTSEQRRRPADTQELLAMWSAAKEQHYVQELVALLPPLLGSSDKLDRKQTEEAAHHLVRALHLAARPEGGIHAALDYLTKMVEGKDRTHPESGPPGSEG